MENDDNQELHKKYDKKQSFYREMETISKKYLEFEQQVYYSPIQDINPQMIIKLQGAIQQRKTYLYKREDLNVINGQYLPEGVRSIERLILQIAQSLPRPKNSYGFIFINSFADSNAYNDFKKVLEALPVEYLLHLTKIYVLEASFLSKALTWLSFGTATNYIKNKTVNIDTLRELSQQTHLDIDLLKKILPKNVVEAHVNVQRQQEYLLEPREMISLRPNTPLMMNSASSSRNQKPIRPHAGLSRVRSSDKFGEQSCKLVSIGGPEITATTKKPKLQILDYQIGPSGAPVILEMLLYFFTNNQQCLQSQGLFRKSVSIDDETEIIQQLNKKNYNYLASVTNPHIIANAIKRFLSSFRTPIIPYDLFQCFMDKENDGPQLAAFVVGSIKQLPKSNRMIIYLLFDFLKNKVIPHSASSKMGENNLCIVFGPCLMRSEVATIKELIYAKKVIIITSIMLREFQNIFGDQSAQTEMRRISYKEYRIEENKQRSSKQRIKPTLQGEIEKQQRISKEEEPKIWHQTSKQNQQQNPFDDGISDTGSPGAKKPQSIPISSSPQNGKQVPK